MRQVDNRLDNPLERRPSHLIEQNGKNDRERKSDKYVQQAEHDRVAQPDLRPPRSSRTTA